jgi:hypothetical protein
MSENESQFGRFLNTLFLHLASVPHRGRNYRGCIVGGGFCGGFCGGFSVVDF